VAIVFRAPRMIPLVASGGLLLACTASHHTPAGRAASPAFTLPVSVPTVTGLAVSGATQLLGRHRLLIKASSARVSSAPEETVLDQDPPAGTLLPPSSTVLVTISAGPHASHRGLRVGTCDLTYLPPSVTPTPCIGGIIFVPIKPA
jgi:hypothetical protein